MICKVCKSIADHPSSFNQNFSHTKLPVGHENNSNLQACVDVGCACLHKPTTTPVENLYDDKLVDLEWVRSRRTIDYSKQGTELAQTQ